MPLPLVKVANKDLKPMSPLEGAMKVSLCLPSTSIGFISSNCIIIFLLKLIWFLARSRIKVISTLLSLSNMGLCTCRTSTCNIVLCQTARPRRCQHMKYTYAGGCKTMCIQVSSCEINVCRCMQNKVHTRTADDQMTDGCCMR